MGLACTSLGCGPDHEGGGGGGATITPFRPPKSACVAQGAIGIDSANNVGYAPMLAQDANGNARVATIDLTKGAANPLLGTVSLPGASFPVAAAYDPLHKSMLVEAIETAGGRSVYEIDASSRTVTNTVALTGLSGVSGDEIYGGIIEDQARKVALVAGLTDVGILDTSQSPPVWNPASVVPTALTDSIGLNTTTGLLFVSGENENQIIDTTQSPLSPLAFDASFGVSEGVAFDPTTNIGVLSPEGDGDERWALNFATLNKASAPATALDVLMPGLGESGITGQGHGGQAAANCKTHQVVSTDEFGQNFTLLQLPKHPVAGALDNNGQPGSGTTADASSAYTIAAASIAQPNINGVQYSVVTQGNPNSLAVDPAHNMLYLLVADHALRQEFFLEIDLSSPVLGASPTGGIDGKTFWNPATTIVQLPKS